MDTASHRFEPVIVSVNEYLKVMGNTIPYYLRAALRSARSTLIQVDHDYPNAFKSSHDRDRLLAPLKAPRQSAVPSMDKTSLPP